MGVSNKDLVNGKESVSAEVKRLFAEIDFEGVSKSEFVSKMLEDVFAPANEVHSIVKHLEAVWRGKAAPTIAELTKAQNLWKSASLKNSSRTEKTLSRMGIASYQPKYPTTQKLKEKMQTSKKS